MGEVAVTRGIRIFRTRARPVDDNDLEGQWEVAINTEKISEDEAEAIAEVVEGRIESVVKVGR